MLSPCSLYKFSFHDAVVTVYMQCRTVSVTDVDVDILLFFAVRVGNMQRDCAPCGITLRSSGELTVNENSISACPSNTFLTNGRVVIRLRPSAAPKKCGYYAPANKRERVSVKPQQNLIGVIRDIVASADSPVSYAAIRAELDSSERYQFKSGVEGYYRTRQITSAVHNHIKKHGERALLQKTADGKVTVRN